MTLEPSRRRRVVGAIGLGLVAAGALFVTCGPGRPVPPDRVWVAEVVPPAARPDARLTPGGVAVRVGEPYWLGPATSTGNEGVILLDPMGPADHVRRWLRGSIGRDHLARYRRTDALESADGTAWRRFDRDGR